MGLSALILCAIMSPTARFMIAAFLAVPQFFLAGLPISVADSWFLCMGIVAIFDRRIRPSSPHATWIVFALAGLYIFAQTWSAAPFASSNLLEIFQITMFGVLVLYASSLMQVDPRFMRTAVLWASPWLALQALLTMLFMYDPSIENSFLKSQVADLLIGPSASALFSGAENNVLDPLKSGGLFVNGNVGSMFCGVAFFLALAAARLQKSWWLGVIALLSWAGALSSGSKTGIALALTLPWASVLFYWVSGKQLRTLLIPMVMALVPLVIWLQNAIPEYFPTYVSRSEISIEARARLWLGAGELFLENPIFGLGFGGWRPDIWALARVDYPPHNFIIDAWASGGIVAALLVLAFMVTVVSQCISVLLGSESPQARGVVCFSLFALVWIFAHGMADNTTFFGESKTMLLAALAVGASAIGVRNALGTLSADDEPSLVIV